MPLQVRPPGVYIEEAPGGGFPTITGAPTSITAFVGRAWRGRTDEPVAIASYADYEREFGGLWRNSRMGHAVQQFFLNGGSRALIVRVAATTGVPAAAATLDLGAGTALVAASPGTWGRNLRATVDHDTGDPSDASLFNLEVHDDPTLAEDSAGRGGSGLHEIFRDVSMDPGSPSFVTSVLAEQSSLVRVHALGGTRPEPLASIAAPASGSDGILQGPPEAATANATSEILGSASGQTGIHALLKADLFNLLCIPPLVFARETTAPEFERMEVDVPVHAWAEAAALCSSARAMLLVDAPADWTAASAPAGLAALAGAVGSRRDAALYFPRIRMADPLQDHQPADFAPCGAVAGIMARIDASRGVWKAPAGIHANLAGVAGLSINGSPAPLTDQEQGSLNNVGVNCLRSMPDFGHVVWGARTLEGGAALAPDWKYVPVRRLALFLEQSLLRGTRWAVFEANDEQLWTRIRQAAGEFLYDQFRMGAFQGSKPGEAYFVRCDRETMTRTDIDGGIVNIHVGFAPLRPAEFVVVKVRQVTSEAPVHGEASLVARGCRGGAPA